MSDKKYYITTAIAYTSAKPHIGNLYEIIMADCIARFKRNDGYDVFFQTGTDEHGQKIEQYAQKAGIEPKEYVDNIAGIVRELWDMANTSYDNFVRTTDAYHEEQVQKIFKKLYDQGDIYLDEYEGMYCTPCEAFWTQTQLNDGRCPDCGGEVHVAKEESYFFRMSKYAQRLIDHIESHPEFIQPISRKNEMMNNFLKPGLQDLCVSRTTFKWSIPVDFNPRHVIYVWLDALTNYITGIGYDVNGASSDQYNKLWPADLHLVGKDIIRFHTIYWPIFLMALGEELPKQVFGHPWLNKDEGKMSKSKGNVLYMDDLIKVFGVDAVRYYVLSEMPYDHDGVISWDLVIERANSDLANTIGNLVNRTIAMTNKYLDGVVTDSGVKEPIDDELKELVTGTYEYVRDKMEELKIADAITAILNLFKRCNKYIDETEPWILGRKEESVLRLKTVLYNLVESIYIGATLIEPVMPQTSVKICEQLGIGKRNYDTLGTFGMYPSGNRVAKNPQILFARLDPEEVANRINEMLTPEEANVEESIIDEKSIDWEAMPEIEYEDFARLQFLVGEIMECVEVPKSKKLLCSKVRIGKEVRQIVSGVKKYYKPIDLIGKKVMVLANLRPVKLAGVLSEGMILFAEDNEGRLVLVAPREDVPSGASIS